MAWARPTAPWLPRAVLAKDFLQDEGAGVQSLDSWSHVRGKSEDPGEKVPELQTPHSWALRVRSGLQGQKEIWTVAGYTELKSTGKGYQEGCPVGAHSPWGPTQLGSLT